MVIEPLDLAEFDLVHLYQGTPHCIKHGAMNKITADGIWRCITVSGYKVVRDGNGEGKLHQETICRAGCAQINKNDKRTTVTNKGYGRMRRVVAALLQSFKVWLKRNTAGTKAH